ncbi:MAG TPA: hypothetical protein VJR91_11360 [Burkholderia sp.]|nr:hypothetical protein [Burkholderia sp.]
MSTDESHGNFSIDCIQTYHRAIGFSHGGVLPMDGDCQLVRVDRLGYGFPIAVCIDPGGDTLGVIAGDRCYRWQWRNACILHLQDVVDGVCPDRGSEITEAAVWRWYVQQGKPWRVDRNHKRLHVRFQDAWARLEEYRVATERVQRRT